MSLSAVEELCISLQRLGPEAQRPPLHPRQAFKAQSKSKTLVGGADELSCTATQAEEAYRHAQHICWLLHTLPQQLQPPSPGWPASSSAPSTPPAPLSPAILVAEPEVQSPFFPNPGHPSPATSVAEVTARARSPSSAKAASPIVIPRSCQNCRTESTPEWRTGPHGPQTLCNACGLQWRRAPQRTGIKPIGSIAKPRHTKRHTKRRGSAPRKGRTVFCA